MRSEHNGIIFFSSYPSRGRIHDQKIVGGAAYTKNLLLQMLKISPSTSLKVYAERFDNEIQTYSEENVTVKRIWKRNNALSVIKSVFSLMNEKEPTVAVSFEINMVGGPAVTILFLLLLPLLRLQGKRLFFILHQVVGSFEPLEQNRIKSWLLDLIKNFLFFFISLVANRIIVFEKKLAHFLPDPSKASVIPLAVENGADFDKSEARKKLNLQPGEFYILYFGFLSPYKGVDKLLDVYTPSLGKLILAGDGNPNHMSDEKYKNYVIELKKRANEKGVLVTGFISEDKIPLYYAACDVVILPYLIFFSSSYPLAFAFSNNKPFLLSDALSGYFESDDFSLMCKETGMDRTSFMYSHGNKTDLDMKMAQIRANHEKYSVFSSRIKEMRSWPAIASKYLQIFNIM
jgi:glycosyltransferase involved in cell wall biosynthesis